MYLKLMLLILASIVCLYILPRTMDCVLKLPMFEELLLCPLNCKSLLFQNIDCYILIDLCAFASSPGFQSYATLLKPRRVSTNI